MAEPLSPSFFSQVSDLVAERMGLHFPPPRWPDLEKGFRSAARELGFSDAASCIQWFLSSPLTRREIETLASHLTVGETYFFRDPQSFKILEERILPELIEKRRAADRRLRIWSAGCATGEEPYSVAILLNEILPDLRDWRITILATDINPRFLERAAKAVYGDWSFRGVPEAVKERYFVKRNNRFEIRSDIKRMVTFSYLNLVEDIYPSLLNNTNAMDLIFCRNVLMYFAPEQAKQAIRRFHQALVNGGWLVVSPSETSHTLFARFSAANFPAAILYQKNGSPAPPRFCATEEPAAPAAPPAASPTPDPEASPEAERETSALAAPQSAGDESEGSYARAVKLYDLGLYEEAAQALSAVAEREPDDGKAMALLARACANQGKLAQALQWCERAMAADKLNPGLHILHATILQEQGALAEANRALKRALYLDQNLALAHFALATLARRQGKAKEARRHLENARRLLSSYPKEQILPESDGLVAGRLMEMISVAAPPNAGSSKKNLRPRAADDERSRG
ncbi:MAG TPA: CheR family methyltransferase [Candidatus Acidoferrales bacterium]|nr:CheR family methyltransferase [Candidatus Acidoferrales bacterium]